MKTKDFPEHQKPKVNWMIIASWLAIILGCCFMAISAYLKHMNYIPVISLCVGLLFFLSSPFFSITGVIKNRKLGGYWLADFCGLASLLLLIILLLPSFTPHQLQLNRAKWSEGRAGMGMISTSIKSYAAEADNVSKEKYPQTLKDLGIAASDLDGSYFNQSSDNMYSFTVKSLHPLKYTITATNSSLEPPQMTLDQDGNLTKIDE